VFTLITPLPDQPPSFDRAADAGFVAACREAAGNNLLLEQQDYGVYLGDRRMKWHDDPELNSGEMFGFGKAFCFYHRQDETLVGLCKLGYATLSDDNGQTWSRPVQPPSLLAGPGKIWGQRTADGRFALAYNPDPGRAKRYPLVIVHGDDGREFRDMRVIHGELVSPRYARRPSSIAYMRGLAEWADDGTFADTKQALWLVYSVSSTPRDNVTVFNPVGMVEAQRTEPGVLVHTIDLSHAVLHWSERLEDGRALARRYGDRVGYVYSTREDTGLFWSNDPALPIGVVLRELRLETMDEQIARCERMRHRALVVSE